MIMKTILVVLLSSLSIVVASRVEARAPTSFKRFIPIPPPPPAPSKRFIIPPPPPPPAPSKRFIPIPPPPPPPAPSKRFIPIPPPPHPPAPSKRVDSFVSLNKRSLVEHAPPPGPSPWFIPRDNTKRDPQALDLSKRSADTAVPQKRGIDEQHVVQADSQRGFCFDGLMACPVLSTPGQFPRTFAEWEAIGFECVDFTADLSSCGGCSSLDPMRHDCTMIPHVQSVACVAGECQVSSCQAGYLPESDGLGCVEME